jgi:hypothetical protein
LYIPTWGSPVFASILPNNPLILAVSSSWWQLWQALKNIVSVTNIKIEMESMNNNFTFETVHNERFTCDQIGWHGCTQCWVWIPLHKEQKWGKSEKSLTHPAFVGIVLPKFIHTRDNVAIKFKYKENFLTLKKRGEYTVS